MQFIKHTHTPKTNCSSSSCPSKLISNWVIIQINYRKLHFIRWSDLSYSTNKLRHEWNTHWTECTTWMAIPRSLCIPHPRTSHSNIFDWNHHQDRKKDWQHSRRFSMSRKAHQRDSDFQRDSQVGKINYFNHIHLLWYTKFLLIKKKHLIGQNSEVLVKISSYLAQCWVALPLLRTKTKNNQGHWLDLS